MAFSPKGLSYLSFSQAALPVSHAPIRIISDSIDVGWELINVPTPVFEDGISCVEGQLFVWVDRHNDISDVRVDLVMLETPSQVIDKVFLGERFQETHVAYTDCRLYRCQTAWIQRHAQRP